MQFNQLLVLNIESDTLSHQHTGVLMQHEVC